MHEFNIKFLWRLFKRLHNGFVCCSLKHLWGLHRPARFIKSLIVFTVQMENGCKLSHFGVSDETRHKSNTLDAEGVCRFACRFFLIKSQQNTECMQDVCRVNRNFLFPEGPALANLWSRDASCLLQPVGEFIELPGEVGSLLLRLPNALQSESIFSMMSAHFNQQREKKHLQEFRAATK